MQKFAWAAETGDLTQLALLSKPSAVHGLDKDEVDKLLVIRSDVLDKELADVKHNFIGEVPQRISAFQAANKLSGRFPDSPQGKVAAKLAAALSSDPGFHKEVSAQKLFNTALAKGGNDGQQLLKLMNVVADRFPGTWYGDRAKQACDELKNGTSNSSASAQKSASTSK